MSGREGLWLYLDCLEALLELFSCSGLMFTDSNYTNIVLKNQTLLTVYVLNMFNPNTRGENEKFNISQLVLC